MSLSSHANIQISLGGEVFIWDKSTARLLHSLKAQDQGSDLTGIAWNHASRSHLMFASAAHDGTVKVWTAPWTGMEGSKDHKHRERVNAEHSRTAGGGIIIVKSPRPIKVTSPKPSMMIS